MRTFSFWKTTSTAASLLAFMSTSPYSGVAEGRLPFTRNRGNNNNNEEEGEDAAAVVGEGTGEAVLLGADLIEFLPARNPVRRNAVLESFYHTSEDSNAAAAAVSQELLQEIRSQAHNLTDFLIQTRRTLHVRPELMYKEEETSAVVQKILSDMGISYTVGWAVNTNQHRIPGKGGYGVIADIGTGQEPCVLLRADMDALPILERTEGIDDFKSRNEGKMHACGHDGHTTMLLGAAAVLKTMEDSLNGTVRLMFQPAEEGGAGAKRMREEGALDKAPRPQMGFGMHVWPTLPSGTVAARPGPLLAAAERFEILVAGVGGHAAMPHLTVDPIVAASAMVTNLQTIVSRNISPLESGVCSITKFEAGEAFNIIPASALLRGTIRALSTETLLSLRDRVQHIVESTATVYGCNVTIQYSPDYYPPTVNDPTLYESFSKHVGAMVAPDGTLLETEPTMGAEDFSFVAEAIPSTFFLLGQGGRDENGKLQQSEGRPPTNYGLHHPHFALDEDILPVGVELHVNLAVRALQKLTREAAAVAQVAES